MERTDLPGRTALYTLMFVPMAIPPFATAAGWILLLGPNAGAINEWIRSLLALEMTRGPLNIYSLWGMMFVTALAVAPSMWLLLIGLLRNMDPTLEEAGETSGLGRRAQLRHITGPLMLPGVLGIVALYAVIGIEIFEIPLAIGLTAGIPVLSTRMYLLTASSSTEPGNYGLAAAYGLLSMVVAVIFIVIYIRVLRQSERFAVVTGKGWRPRRIALGNWRYAAMGFVWSYLFLAAILPFLILLWSSLLRFYQVPSFGALGAITTAKFVELFQHRQIAQAAWNSVLVMLLTPTISILLAATISWIIVRVKSSFSSCLSVLSFLPLGIPGTVAALGFLVLFIQTPVYGTVGLLIFAYVFRFLAFTTRLTNASQMQIDKCLDEAALTSGIGGIRTFFLVNMKLMAPALVNGWLWVAVFSMRDFTFPLFLANFESPVWANIIWQKFEEGGPSAASPAVVVFVVFTIVVILTGKRWLRFGLERD
jgi:iron(III) transport system permease protein